MNIEPVAYFSSPLTSKFGIPRQSGILSDLPGKVVFCPEYRFPEALRGLDGFDYIWLLWGFSENAGLRWHPTVRPPRLGGNKAAGVFATRSPFRPNALGLSAVRIASIEPVTPEGPVIRTLGADLMDGTPIYDIKPYLPYSDCLPDARGGFAPSVPEAVLDVKVSAPASAVMDEKRLSLLCRLLSLDPRPAYQDDPERIYGMSFDGFEVKFTVSDNILTITDIFPDVTK